MVVQQSGNTILSRWYSGSSYVKETAGGVTKQYTFIGGDAYTAPVVAIKTGTGTPVYYYLLRDYLGSITHVVNTSKTTVAEYSYDSWGRMRNPTNWTNYAPGTEPALFVAGRGFTGHEHMPWFNSINMNGRIYDPLIGQFLSPDNYVQDPTFTQNYNRYTYCLNNPLKYSDPSGMLVAPADFGRTIDAYQNWLCDVTAERQYGGGGGGGWGGHVIGADQDYVGTTLYNSDVRFYGYSYNGPTNTYYSKFTGEVASWGEVYSNYVVPKSIISLSGKVAQDLIKVYQREISSSLFGINNWEASLLAGPGGAVDLAYQIANTLNEFNPVAQLWDVIAYALTGKDRFGNQMSLTQASLKALCVVPVPIGNLGKMSPGLQALFKEGVGGNSIINIRNTLLNNGFKQSLTTNKSGYLFINDAGEQIRIMSRNGGWDIRIQNQYGNYLNAFGIDPGTRSATHGIKVYSR
jgi:RHS repeat-associated protein